MKTLLEPIMPEKNRQEFAAKHDTDFAYEIAAASRASAPNVFQDRKGMGAVFRVIPVEDPHRPRQLGLSPAILRLVQAAQRAWCW